MIDGTKGGDQDWKPECIKMKEINTNRRLACIQVIGIRLKNDVSLKSKANIDLSAAFSSRLFYKFTFRCVCLMLEKQINQLEIYSIKKVTAKKTH